MDLPEGLHVVGSGTGADVLLKQQGVADRHLALRLKPERLQVEDLAGGVTVNGRPITEHPEVALPASIELKGVILKIEQHPEAVAHSPLDLTIPAQPTPKVSFVLEVTIPAPSTASEIGKNSDVTIAVPRREAVSRIAPAQPPGIAQNKAALTTEYTLVHEIARGGMGQIYSGEDPQLKRQVAVKVSTVAHGGIDPRFTKEAEVLAQLAHPNVVPIHNIGVDALNRPFYAMKLVKGRTLQAILHALREDDPAAHKDYPTPTLLTIFRKVCDAMMFAHSKRILHRDLKPDNIMVGEYGEVLVMDWGLSKILGQNEEPHATKGTNRTTSSPGDFGITMEGSVMGTPQYMSPEQAEGMVADLDERSDIYALGAILYAVLTLHPPIDGTTLDEVLTKVKRGEISAMHILRSEAAPPREKPRDRLQIEVPEALKAVTLKAMSTKRDDRYPTVEAFVADIEAYQNGFATSALHVSALGQFLLLVKRNKGVTVSIATAILAITALTAWFVLSLQTKQRAATHAAEVAEEEKNKALRAESIAQNEKNKALQAESIAQNEKNKALQAESIAQDEKNKALQAESIAQGEKNKALQAEKLARLSSSKAQIALAEASFRSGDFPAMTEALDLCPPDLRDQTWDYLAAKRDSSIGTLKIPGFEKLVTIREVPGAAGQFALATAQGEVGFAQADSGQLLRTVKTPTGLRDLVFSGDGLTFLTVVGTKELLLHDTATGELRTQITLPSEIKDSRGDIMPAAESIALNQDGSLLAAVVKAREGSTSVSLLLFAVADGGVQWRTDLGNVTGIQFDREGKRLIAISGGSTRYCWGFDTTNGKKLFETPLFCLCQAIHPDGKTAAIGSSSGELRIIDLASGVIIQNAKLHSGRLVSMAWTTDGHLLTMGTEGKIYDSRWLFKLWAPDTLALRAVFSGLRPGYPVRWAHDPLGGYLLTADTPPRIWRIPAGRELARMNHRSESGYSGAFLSDTLLLAREGWGLTFYDVSTPGKWVRAKDAPVWPHRYSAVHQQTGFFAITGVDRPITLQLFSANANTPKELFVAPLAGRISDLCFHPKGDAIAATLTDGSLLTFTVPAGEPRLKLPGKFQKIAFSETGNRLIASCAGTLKSGITEYQLQQIDGATGANLKTAPTRFEIQALAVSPDQSVLAVGGIDRSIHFFDPRTLEEKQPLRAHEGEISALTFHPTAPILASASSDGSVKLWNYQTGRMLDHFIGLAGVPVTLAFSPNGRLLFADAEERTMRLYDVSHLNALSEPK